MLDTFGRVILGKDITDAIRRGTGFAAVVTGSDSDASHVETLCSALDRFDIPHTAGISSAHKMPGLTEDIFTEGLNRVWGSLDVITCAGGLDALSGTASFLSQNLVISSSPDKDGPAYVLNDTCLRNPAGSSNIYIREPSAVARFVAQHYAGVNPAFRERLHVTGLVGVDTQVHEYLDGAAMEAVKKNTGYAAVLCFSNATQDADRIGKALKSFNVPYQIVRFPQGNATAAVNEMMLQCNSAGGTMVYVSTVPFFAHELKNSLHPVITIIHSPEDARQDASLAYVIRSENAARAAAQMFAGFNQGIADALETSRARKIGALLAANEGFTQKYTKI